VNASAGVPDGVTLNGGPVGFVGLGVMGLPMAVNLVRAGFEVHAWNRSPRGRDAARAAGCRTAGTPADVARSAPTVITMLPDIPEVRSLLDRPDGLLGTGMALDTLVLMGTVSPVGVRELATELAGRGVALVDAPVSGGEKAARAAALSIMVGADPVVFERVRPYLTAMGTTVCYMGSVGSGSLTKACNQLVVAGTMAALAEAVLLAERGGLDREALLHVLEGGLAASEVLTQKRYHLATGDFAGSGAARYLVKDLRFALEGAGAANVTLPVTAAVARLYADVLEQGLGDLDTSAVLDLLRRMSPPRE
jgi:2-hydroxy-3-oxopropionate reductase